MSTLGDPSVVAESGSPSHMAPMSPAEKAHFRRLDVLVVAAGKTHGRINRKMRKVLRRLELIWEAEEASPAARSGTFSGPT